jgi:hypothetical protein
MHAYDCSILIDRERLHGDVAECGVWAGGTIGLMAAAAACTGTAARTFHLFDSFEGLPQPSAYDTDVLAQFEQHHPFVDLDGGDNPAMLTPIGACAAPLDAVNELIDDVLKLDRSKIIVHKGWFQDTIPAAARLIGDLAVLRIDGDWYESTKVCLQGLYGNVVDGGFVIIDDYDEFSGCRRAVDEFLQEEEVAATLTRVPGAGVWFRKPPSPKGRLADPPYSLAGRITRS